jgi:glucosamine-6-phosphate deaminase
MTDTTVRHFKVEKLKIEIHPDSKSAGEDAARAVAQVIHESAQANADVGVVFAAAASQLHLLRALVSTKNLPWNKLLGFHLDEYVGISADHPASFRRFLRENLTQHVTMRKFFEMDGNASDPHQACREYAEKLQAANLSIGLIGIGENGHLAFNDPPEADFNDPLIVKTVHLDQVCKQQQVAEGWFRKIEDVPTLAMTLTISAIMRIPKLIVSVPGIRKASIIRTALHDPVSTACPATILRTHPDATVYLDRDSASALGHI